MTTLETLTIQWRGDSARWRTDEPIAPQRILRSLNSRLVLTGSLVLLNFILCGCQQSISSASIVTRVQIADGEELLEDKPLARPRNTLLRLAVTLQARQGSIGSKTISDPNLWRMTAAIWPSKSAMWSGPSVTAGSLCQFSLDPQQDRQLRSASAKAGPANNARPPSGPFYWAKQGSLCLGQHYEAASISLQPVEGELLFLGEVPTPQKSGQYFLTITCVPLAQSANEVAPPSEVCFLFEQPIEVR